MLDRPGIRLGVILEDVASIVTQHELLKMAQVEISRQLSENPDLQILVKEMVADAISKMNLQEVVGLAVREHLNIAKEEAKD